MSYVLTTLTEFVATDGGACVSFNGNESLNSIIIYRTAPLGEIIKHKKSHRILFSNYGFCSSR